MRAVNNWLVTWTAGLLRHPRSFIMVPILTVFLLSYPSVYDFTLGPLTGSLLAAFDDCHTSTGLQIAYQDLVLDSSLRATSGNLTVTRISFEGSNALKYDSLKELSEWTQRILGASAIISPLSYFPESTISSDMSEADEKQAEKCFLKIVNHHLPLRVVSLFFNKIEKQNHLIKTAQQMTVFVLSEDDGLYLPQWSGKSLCLLPQSLSVATKQGDDFVSFLDLISKKCDWLNWMVQGIGLAQAILIFGSIFRVYLSICNSHKIRSSLGLMTGWLNSVSLSAFASLAMNSRTTSDLGWPYMSDPMNSLIFGFYQLTILILSSRNLFRTVNDLAGDSSFGEPESLHKRLIKFYLGFNSSTANSEGVFRVSSFIRRLTRLDTYCYLAPVPNTTIILMINIMGLLATTGSWALLFRIFMSISTWQSFCRIFVRYLRLTITTLIIDHILQLSYMVAIIVIDLYRVDLTDVLAKATTEDDLDVSNLHEVNPISAILLTPNADGKSSWRHNLGTSLLKVSPHSPKLLWQKILPLLGVCTCAAIAFQAALFAKASSAKHFGLLDPVNVTNDDYDALYLLEFVTIVVLIVTISGMTFTLKFSNNQKRNLSSIVMSNKNEIAVSDLSNIDSTHRFEVITLFESHAADKLGLFANSNAPFLVTIDMDHNILLWSPLARGREAKFEDISTVFETTRASHNNVREFWPVNHVEVSNNGNYVMLINNRNCRLKCYCRRTQTHVWELSLTSELAHPQAKMKPVLCFFRKKTVAGFFARELLSRRKKLATGNKRGSSSSLNTMHGNYPPPFVDESANGSSGQKVLEKEKTFNREEFVMILESGEMITVSCDSIKVKVYNLLAEVFSGDHSSSDLKIVSSRFISTARVNDRVLCVVSNDQVVVGSAVNNLWRFSKLKINNVFTSDSPVNFAPPLMTRGTWDYARKTPQSHIYSKYHIEGESRGADMLADQNLSDFEAMNESTIVAIDFVGMFVRVKDLRAELIDIQTGTVLRLFHIGSFKPGTFRVSHSEPTHCKFCGCVSFEFVSLIYEDLYDRTLIVHTFQLENKKSRNNICLRVERDPLEIRCLGFDAVVEKQYWFNDIEMWELTDMNIIIGLRKFQNLPDDELDSKEQRAHKLDDSSNLSSLRNRKIGRQTRQKNQSQPLEVHLQGFVVTVSNGRILDYDIPIEQPLDKNICSKRPTIAVKFGFKAVAIAFGHIVKVVYLGNDKLIENDLYYSGSVSTINPLLGTTPESISGSSELLFINKRRRMIERKIARSST